jgi:serine-type D-Ala-D-Ala carboxypeptidase (penicillin-binding protein 5/6)
VSRRTRRLAVFLVAAILSPVAGASLAAGSPGPTATPPPTPVGPKKSPSPFPTVLHTPAPAPSSPPFHGTAAVLEDMKTGQVLYAKNPGKEVPIASLTKIMTAVLVLRRTSPNDIVTVTKLAADTPPSKMGLKEGEEITVHNLLLGLMLASANDAAVALAERVSGSVPAFVELMNHRAEQLGLSHSRFASPNGLSDQGYSTARDLATLTETAYRVPGFRQLVSTKVAEMPGPDKERVLQNRNVMLWLYPGTTGVKTGFTFAARWCVVTVTSRARRHLVAVVLGDPTQGESFSDAATLLNYGFHEFRPTTIAVAGRTEGTVLVEGEPVTVEALANLVRLVRVNRLGDVRSRFVPADGVSLPVSTGDHIGRLRFFAGNRVIGSVQVAATESVLPPPTSPPPQPPERLAPRFENALRVLDAMARAALGAFL